MENSPMIYWLIAGVVLFFAEMGVPGIGLLFAGCGALTVGMLLNFAVVAADNYVYQAMLFLCATALWSIILWKPIQKLRLGKNRAAYSNIIGESATVTEKGVSKIHGGEVTWSGTLMKAKLPENSQHERLEAGTVVIIQDICGNILTVSPK